MFYLILSRKTSPLSLEPMCITPAYIEEERNNLFWRGQNMDSILQHRLRVEDFNVSEYLI